MTVNPDQLPEFLARWGPVGEPTPIITWRNGLLAFDASATRVAILATNSQMTAYEAGGGYFLESVSEIEVRQVRPQTRPLGNVKLDDGLAGEVVTLAFSADDTQLLLTRKGGETEAIGLPAVPG